jgi:hypothetical protein
MVDRGGYRGATAATGRRSMPHGRAGGRGYPPRKRRSVGAVLFRWLVGIAFVAGAVRLIVYFGTQHGWAINIPDFASQLGTTPPTYQSAAVPQTVAEEMPSVLQGIRPLSASQAKFCLAQGVRMQAAAKAVNTASAEENRRFVALADDYNPRCGNYHYTPGVFDLVKEEVEAERATLELQGVALIRVAEPEEKPPVARGALLPEPQVRYCLAQGIRLQGAAKAVNTASAEESRRFLALADDYNPRCGDYKPAPGVTNAVKERVEARRIVLEGEGAALIRPPARF